MADPLLARHCVVCSIKYLPRRKDQIYCSMDYNYTCEMRLHHAEVVDVSHLFHKALERQQYRCFECGAEPGDAQDAESARGKSLGLTRRVTLRPLIVAPHKVGTDTELDENDVVASCRECRTSTYLKIATTT